MTYVISIQDTKGRKGGKRDESHGAGSWIRRSVGESSFNRYKLLCCSVVLFWVSIVVGLLCVRGCRGDLHRRRLRRKTCPRWPLLYLSCEVEGTK